MANRIKPEHHAVPSTGISVEKEPATVQNALGILLPQGPTAPAHHRNDPACALELAQQQTHKELRAARGLAFKDYMSFPRALVAKDHVGVARDATAAREATTTTPQDTLRPGLEHARQRAREELRACSGMTLRQIDLFLRALDEDRAGLPAPQGALMRSFGRARQLLRDQVAARQLVHDELGAASGMTASRFAFFLYKLNEADQAGAEGADKEQTQESKPLDVPENDNAAALVFVPADGTMARPINAARAAPACPLRALRRLSEPGSLTPSPPPRAVPDRKRGRDEEDYEADVAPAAKHRRVGTDPSAGSSQSLYTHAASSTEPTRAIEPIPTTAALAAVEHEEDCENFSELSVAPRRRARGRKSTPFPFNTLKDDEDEDGVELSDRPMQSVHGRIGTPCIPRSMVPVACTFTVEFETGGDAVEIKREPEDDVQLATVHLDSEVQVAQDAGNAAGGAEMPSPDSPSRLEPLQQRGGRKPKAGRRGKTKCNAKNG